MDAIKRLTKGGGYGRPLTPEERKARDELFAESDRWAQNEGAEFLANASKPDAKGPKPEGEKITPEEVAKAFGAKIVGRTSKTLP